MSSAPEPVRVLVVIPAHNEESRLGLPLREYVREARTRPGLRVDFLVVLNGCRDRTQQVVEAAAAELPEVSWLRYDAAIGKGGAVIAGLALASGHEWAGFVDADGATPPGDFFSLLDGAGDAAALIAVRDMSGRPLSRRFPSRLFNLWARSLFFLPHRDTQCGAKFFRVTALRAILPHLRLSGMAFDVEMLVGVRRAGGLVKEVPVRWSEKPGTTVSLIRTGARMFLDLLRLRLGLAGRPVLERLPASPDARHVS